MKIYNSGANSRILSHIPDTARTALDLGCATGKMALALDSLGIDTDGVSFNADECKLAAKHCRKVWNFDLEKGFPDDLTGPYDAVILSHIMEHIANPNKLLECTKNVLKPNGLIICTIPNMLFLYNRLKLLVGKIEYSDSGLMDYTHVRWYTKMTLIEKMSEFGFVLTHFDADGYAPLGPFRRVLSDRLCKKISRILISLSPSWFAWEYSFVFLNPNITPKRS